MLVGFYREAEAATGVPWPYLAAINFVETRMGRIHGDSTAGAQGPMQFIASTWDAFGNGGDVHDPHDSILAAGRFLASRGALSDMRRALYSYNNSDDYVDSVQRYADLIAAGQERVYSGFYHWQVYFATTRGLASAPRGLPRSARGVLAATLSSVKACDQRSSLMSLPDAVYGSCITELDVGRHLVRRECCSHPLPARRTR